MVLLLRSLAFAFLGLAVALASPLDNIHPFGTGLSQAKLSTTETELFTHTLREGSTHGVLNHFWAAGSPGVDSTVIRYYIDGEAKASVVFTPSQMAGACRSPPAAAHRDGL